jgi:hypothetical protein
MKYYEKNHYFIPFSFRSKILAQLATGTYFNLLFEEWNLESGKDYNATVLYYYDEKGQVHIKMTNDDRRKLIREWNK